MSEKRFKPIRIAPLQELEVEPIADPAEIAWFEEMLRKSREVTPSDEPWEASSSAKKATAAEVLQLARRLSAKERFLLATQLAAQLPAKKRVELVEQLMAPKSLDKGRRNGHQRRD